MQVRIKKITISLFSALARLTIWKYRPGVIGVTGSVGKTSTKQAILAVFGNDRKTRASHCNFNDSIGLSLTVLGDWNEKELDLFSLNHEPKTNRIRKLLFLVKVALLSTFRLIFNRQYPELLILEYGIDYPGGMRDLLKIVRPNIAIITAIGEVPAHVEFFSGPEAVAREKARLIEFLPAAGFAILNSDDMTVLNIKERTRAKIINFGFGPLSTVRVSNLEHRVSPDGVIGINFKIGYSGSFVPIRLDNCIGKTHAYAVSAAVCIGLIFGLNLVKIAENLKGYRALKGRSLVCRGIKETVIIDDSYNASPMSMHAGLDTLNSIKAKRKIAILGDMLEIGEYAPEAHEEIGKLAAKSADLLFTVGPRAKFIAEGARGAKMNKRYIKEFDTADDARIIIQDTLRKGDLVLIKASHSMQLEKIVEEIKLPDTIVDAPIAPVA